MKKDYGTKPVEMAWIAPFRKYAPAVLVLCIVALLSIALFFPFGRTWSTPDSLTAQLIFLLIYVALAALATFLFIEARQREVSTQREIADTEELYGLSERLTTTLQSIGEGVIATDVDGLVTLMNDVAIQLTGWHHTKATGASAQGIFRIINEETRAPIEDPSSRVLAAGKRIREDTTAILLSRTGKEYPIAYHAAPILDSDGWIIGVVVVFQDVTNLRAVQRHREQLIEQLSQTNDRLRVEIAKREEGRRAALNLMQDAQLAQVALRESEERLRALFEGIDDALFVHDTKGRLLECNPAACSILHYPREQLLSMSISHILREQEEESTAKWLITQDQLPIPVLVHTSTIKYSGKKAFLTVARDITELKNIQDELRASNEQLRESNSALEEYARVASHDLQEPLRKVESFAQVLMEDYGSKIDEQGREYLDIMVNSARRMRRLIRDVLAFSRAGSAEKPFSQVNLNEVLDIVKDNLSELIHDTGAVITAQNLPTIYGDETQMIQLFQNLVGNGLKFNDKPNPRVEVFCKPSNSEWKIFIQDNGIGMRKAESQVIFAPFKRLHSQQKFEGTGIGLAICRRIAARHGGTIGVESELNKGSMFWLTLPKTTKQLREQAGEKADKTEKRKE